MKIYAGIGSRKTPHDILTSMENGAAELQRRGWMLRSGHADGADLAFERGAAPNALIHLPWASYNNQYRYGSQCIVPIEHQLIWDIAAAHHPVWNRLSSAVQRLMYRNATIVLGTNGDDPAEMVICWTPGGRYEGGTAHGMRIADTFGIPIFNLADPSSVDLIDQFIS